MTPSRLHLNLRILAAVLVFGTLAIFGAVLAAGHRLVPDDVFFYLEIADRIVRGEGSTFSGLMPTNGYHPLWMGLNVGLRALVGEDPATRVSALFVATALGNLAAIALSWRLSRRLGLSLLLAPVLIAAYTSMNHLGSELHVSLPLILASVLATLSVSASHTRLSLENATTHPGPIVWILLGALFGLTALARLDNAFCIAALGLVVLDWRGPRPILFRNAALLGLGGALVLGPYFAWNLVTFGHLVPISGSVKSGLASLAGPAPLKMGTQGLILFAVTVFAPLYLWQRVRRFEPGSARRQIALTMFAFSLGALTHGVYVLMWGQAVWTWYFATELVTASFVVAAIIDHLVSRREPILRWSQVALPVFAAAVLGLVFVRHLRVDSGPRWYEDAAAWIDREVPATGAIVTTNSPGAMAFFAERPIVALDGLTGDFAWHERSAEVGLYEALRERGVTHVVSMGARSPHLAPWIERTRLEGHGGEGPTFEGNLLADGMVEPLAVGMFSGIVMRQVGWLATTRDTLVSDCPCGFSMWRLAPGPALR